MDYLNNKGDCLVSEVVKPARVFGMKMVEETAVVRLRIRLASLLPLALPVAYFDVQLGPVQCSGCCSSDSISSCHCFYRYKLKWKSIFPTLIHVMRKRK